MRAKIFVPGCILSCLSIFGSGVAASAPNASLADVAGTWLASVTEKTKISGQVIASPAKNIPCVLTQVKTLKGTLLCGIKEQNGSVNGVTGEVTMIHNGKTLLWSLDAQGIGYIESGIAKTIAAQAAQAKATLGPVNFKINSINYKPIPISKTHILGKGSVTIKGIIKAEVNGQVNRKNFTYSAVTTYLSRQP